MIKTVKVKLHNPSKHKRAILDRVFLRWTLASDLALRWAQEHLDTFDGCKDQRENYRADLIAEVLRQRVGQKVKHFGLHSSLEAALWRDIGRVLASFFERLKQDPNTGYPTLDRVKPNSARYEAALEALATWNPTNACPEQSGGVPIHNLTFIALQSELLAAARELDFHPRPIYFSRPDAVPHRRNFSILYDEERDRYLALLYLVPGDASERHRKPLIVRKPLLALNKHEEYLRETGRASSALLFPLEMGSWQQRTFFDLAREDPLAIRTAQLIREVNRKSEVEYYLAIGVDLSLPEPIEPVNILAVHHTLEGEVYALVTNFDGKVLHYEQVAGPLEREDALQQRRAWQRRGKRTPHRVVRERAKHHYHAAANRIVTLAVKHRTRVGVEDLSYRRIKTDRKAVNRRAEGAPVGQLTDLLSYKLPFAGLPAPLKVGGISPRECHRCDKDSREKTVRADGCITCPLCGLEMDEHQNTAHLVAAQLPDILARIAAARRKRESGKGKMERGEGRMERGKWKGEDGTGKMEER